MFYKPQNAFVGDVIPQYRDGEFQLFYFQEDLKVTIQQIGVCHKGLFERQDDVSTVDYWYQAEPHNQFGDLLDTEDRWPR